MLFKFPSLTYGVVCSVDCKRYTSTAERVEDYVFEKEDGDFASRKIMGAIEKNIELPELVKVGDYGMLTTIESMNEELPEMVPKPSINFNLGDYRVLLTISMEMFRPGKNPSVRTNVTCYRFRDGSALGMPKDQVSEFYGLSLDKTEEINAIATSEFQDLINDIRKGTNLNGSQTILSKVSATGDTVLNEFFSEIFGYDYFFQRGRKKVKKMSTFMKNEENQEKYIGALSDYVDMVSDNGLSPEETASFISENKWIFDENQHHRVILHGKKEDNRLELNGLTFYEKGKFRDTPSFVFSDSIFKKISEEFNDSKPQ